MANEQKRPIDYSTAAWPASDDYVMIDGTGNGTRKIKANNVYNIGALTNIFDLRSGDSVVRSSVVKAGNVVVMSAIISIGSDVAQNDGLLTFKSEIPSAYGAIVPGYSFDVLAMYGSSVKSMQYDSNANAFKNSYGTITAATGSTLRFQVTWIVEEE